MVYYGVAPVQCHRSRAAETLTAGAALARKTSKEVPGACRQHPLDKRVVGAEGRKLCSGKLLHFIMTALFMIDAGEGVEKRETLVHWWWECKFVQPLWKALWRFFKN